MRVISGSARGLKLYAPLGMATRPTIDRIKEDIFNMISPYVYESSFLDLFSGSGAIGIEALSRGACDATFVDINNINILNDNILRAKVKEKATIIDVDATKAIYKLYKDNKKFDIIFLDPPYSKEISKSILIEIETHNILNDDGIIICEQHIDEQDILLTNLYAYKIKKYKTTKITFFEFNKY